MTTLLLLLVLFTTQKLAVAMDTHITSEGDIKPESDKGCEGDLRPKKQFLISDLDLNQCMNARSNGVLPWILEGSGVILNREAFSGKVFSCLAKKDVAYR